MAVPWRFNPQRPWRNGLIATTGITLVLFGANQLWNAGWAEWAFMLAFVSIWCLLSMLWSNDDHIEQSNLMLADIVDQNFDQMHERLTKLEEELQRTYDLHDSKSQQAA
jgi:hypothetical protein